MCSITTPTFALSNHHQTQCQSTSGTLNVRHYLTQANIIAQFAVLDGRAAGFIQYCLDKTLTSTQVPIISGFYAQWIVPSIAIQLQNQSAAVGQSAILRVKVNGSAPFDYQWRFGGGTTFSGTTNASYVLASAQTNNSGVYSVTVSNLFGSIVSSNVALCVGEFAPIIYADLPSELSGRMAGQPLALSVGVAGAEPLQYQWLKNSTNLADGLRFNGSQSNTLTIARAEFSDSGTYQLVITNAYGSAWSTPPHLPITSMTLNEGAGWTANGRAAIADNTLTLLDGGDSQAQSCFLNAPQYIGAFEASFTYQDANGGGADGATFVVQNDPRGPSAIGGMSGGLGYSGITPSAALEFNVYIPNKVGIAFRTNGVTGAPFSITDSVALNNGHPIGVRLRYMAGVLSVMLTDAMAAVSFTTNYVSDLPAVLGTNRAWVGFTGGSRSVASVQTISSLFFTSLLRISVQGLAADSVTFSLPDAAGFELQQTTNLAASSWSAATNHVSFADGQCQFTVPQSGQSRYYRLKLLVQ